MKFLAVFAIFAVVACQERPTVTGDLQAAQAELTIGHEFAEMYMINNRERLSNYLMTIERAALDQFMGAYALIKNIGIETRQIMDDYEQSFCKDRIRARWEIQVTRYGQRLSQCLGDTHRNFALFTTALNLLHTESRPYSNLIPNASVNVLSRLDIFTGRDRLGAYINNDFRELLFTALDLQRQFTEFVNEISIDVDNLIERFTRCYVELPAEFRRDSDRDLESIRMCYSD